MISIAQETEKVHLPAAGQCRSSSSRSRVEVVAGVVAEITLEDLHFAGEKQNQRKVGPASCSQERSRLQRIPFTS